MAIATGDSVTIEYTGRLEDGTVFDTSRETVAKEAGLAEAQPDRGFSPLTVDIGGGEIIEGLEEALVGLEEGTTHTVTIPPEKAYGERSDDQLREFEADEFSQMIGGQTPEEGAYIETQEDDLAEIVHVDEDVVRIDFSHELVGKTLEFDVEIVDIS